MTAPSDTDRLIRAFLEGGPTELPDRTYDEVRVRTERTRQRVVIGPWREPRMTTVARITIAAAAVIVMAMVAVEVLPRESSLVGPAPTPSQTPTQASAPVATPAPTTGPMPSRFPTSAADSMRIPAPLHGRWEATLITGFDDPRVPNGSYSLDLRSDVLLTGPVGTLLREYGGAVEVIPRDAPAYTYTARIVGPCGAGRYVVERRPEDQIRFTLVEDPCAERAAILTDGSWVFASPDGPRLGPFTAGQTYDSGTFTEPFRFVMPDLYGAARDGDLFDQFRYASRYVSDGGLRMGGPWWSMRILDDLPLNVDVCDDTTAMLPDIPSTPEAVGEWLRSSGGVSVSDPVEVPVDGRTALRFDIGEGASPCLGARLPPGGWYPYLMRAYAIPTGDDTILLVFGSDAPNYEVVKAAMEALVRSMDFE